MGVYKGTPTKDGRMYYFKNCINGQQYCSQKFMTRQEAIDQESLYRLTKVKVIHKKFELVAKDYFEHLSKTKKEATYYGHYSVYKNQIKPYFEQKSIGSINVQDINEWKDRMLKKGYKLNFLGKCYSILNSIFKHARKNFDLQDNVVEISGPFELPNDEVKPDDKKIRYITLDEFKKFISVVEDTKWIAFFSLLYYTGMRKGEVQALTWNDIDFENKRIIVDKNLSVKTQDDFKITSTKNNQNRTISMSKNLLDIMLKYKQEVSAYEDFNNKWFVFGIGTKRFLPQTTIDRMKHKYFELSGVREITIHEFRHSHVSLLINEYIKSGQTDTGKFFLMMSARMGHTIDVMQSTYMHLFPSIQNEIVNLLDNI